MQNRAPLEIGSSTDAHDPAPETNRETGLSVVGPGSAAGGNETSLQRFESLRPGSVVIIDPGNGSSPEKYFVRQCAQNGAHFNIKVARTLSADDEAAPETEEPNYYDVLQIGKKADTETIYRVYRIMAARFHPDNPKTGNVDMFLLLKTAYEVLSDPARRAEYDARLEEQDAEPMPIFEMKDFVTGVEAESNRRMGVLSLLYNQRRQDPEHPVVSLLHLEQRMAFPREYLSFTMWYLRAKGFVTAADNADYVITAPGVEYVEANIGKSEILDQLLFPGRK